MNEHNARYYLEQSYLNRLELFSIEETVISENLLVNGGRRLKELILEAIKAIKNFFMNIIEYFRNKKPSKKKQKMIKGELSSDITIGDKDLNIDEVDPADHNVEYDFTCFHPNKEKMKEFLNILFKDSMQELILPVQTLVNSNNPGVKDELYEKVFGDANSDTYSNNNDFIFATRDYLKRKFNTDIKNMKEFDDFYKDYVNRYSIEYSTNTNVLLEEIKNKKNKNDRISIDNYSCSLCNDEYEVMGTFFDISKKCIKNLDSIKNAINKNKDDVLDVALYRLVTHYGTFVTNIKVDHIINSYLKAEDEIYKYVLKIENIAKDLNKKDKK